MAKWQHDWNFIPPLASLSLGTYSTPMTSHNKPTAEQGKKPVTSLGLLGDVTSARTDY